MNTKHRKIKLILRYFHGSKRYFLCAIFASLATTAFNALTPQIFRFTIDQVLGGGGYEYLRGHLWILSLGIVGGTTIRIMADGSDEQLAVDGLVHLVESGFAE